MRATARRRGAAERLLALEAEEHRLCARMQQDRVRRNLIGEEITALRCGLSDGEADRYRRLKFREERL